MLAGGAFAAWHWVRQQYFVGVYGDQVAVFRGLPQDLGPVDLATLDHTTGVLVAELPPADRDSVRAGIVVDSSVQATAKVTALREPRPAEPRQAAGDVHTGTDLEPHPATRRQRVRHRSGAASPSGSVAAAADAPPRRRSRRHRRRAPRAGASRVTIR